MLAAGRPCGWNSHHGRLSCRQALTHELGDGIDVLTHAVVQEPQVAQYLTVRTISAHRIDFVVFEVDIELLRVTGWPSPPCDGTHGKECPTPIGRFSEVRKGSTKISLGF